jgi:hypothetical protein
MFVVLGAFVISPDALVESIRLALAVGCVLIDAFVVASPWYPRQ